MSLNVIGLISGGKDSLYSLVHCIENGHKVVALANLYPEGELKTDQAEEGEDINSFMYQTVGHSVIPLYAEALGLPLYRRSTRGTATQSGRYYDSTACLSRDDGANPPGHEPWRGAKVDTVLIDETEDMFLLLQEVLTQHPEASAVNAGAILSTYQRTRVESVAVRLGLTPLAYLWQYPALPPPVGRDDTLTTLLDDMETAGCDARIIKVASGGIRTDLLWSNVASPTTRSRLIAGLSRFHNDQGQQFELRGALLGEGGEYETLALDGPNSLWQGRIDLKAYGSYEAEGGATYAKFAKAAVVAKDQSHDMTVPIPSTFDNRFTAAKLKVAEAVPTPTAVSTMETEMCSPARLAPCACALLTRTSLHIANLTFIMGTAAEQLSYILENLLPRTITDSVKLHPYAAQLSTECLRRNIVSSTLLLRNVNDFAAVNKIYTNKLWPEGLPNPPSRVTIAAPLPNGVQVSLNLVFDLSPVLNASLPEQAHQEREGLHVQSRSYWTPANIGPYSQAINSPIFVPSSLQKQQVQTPFEVVHVAGQIPLLPASMDLIDASHTEQGILALQHLWRVGQERKVSLWAGAGVAYLARNPSTADLAQGAKYSYTNAIVKAQDAARIWLLAHRIDEKGTDRAETSNVAAQHDADEREVDVWDLQQNRGLASTTSSITTGEHLYILPNCEICSASEARSSSLADSVLACTVDEEFNPVPSFIAAEVSDLPRHAPIEWWSTGLAGLSLKTEHANIHSIKSASQNGWSAQGLVLEHRHATEEIGDDETDLDLRNSRMTSHSLQVTGQTFFLTLTVDMHSTSHTAVPDSIRDLEMALLNEAYLGTWTCDLVTAQCFVNMSSPADIRQQLDGSNLVHDAVTIPCYHVWTTHEECLSDNGKEPAIEEVAAAFVLRIDAWPA